MPYVFATGYGATGIAPRYRDSVIVKKPYVVDDIRHAIQNVLVP